MSRVSIAVLALVVGCSRDVELIAGRDGGPPSGCDPPYRLCSGACVDPRSDPVHCGGCDTVCGGATPVCSTGACAATCGADLANCSNRCVDLSTTPAHCGGCDRVCPSGQCSGGQCACPTGTVWCKTGCVDLTTDLGNCGGCGKECGTGSCVSGQCVCGVTSQQCGEACTDVRFDPINCGACDHPCGNAEACSGGECACRTGLTRVSTECVDLATDPTRCGPSQLVCGDATPSCQDGACVAECSGDVGACDGACVDRQRDALNCGECGHRCAVSQVCVEGECFDYQVSGAASCAPSPCGANRLCCLVPPITPAICVNGDAPRCPT
ncbi:MAG: hypothetical protein HY906_24340 [Deltaproteobacteria bacterium]|nr:hypothetical protein [Deltaproteobacteria bacterium]